MSENWIDIIMDTDGSQRKAIGESDFLVKHATGLMDTWETFAYRKEPDDLVGKIFYWAGTISQLVLNLITQPFGIAAFLLEESAQAIGMGGYILYSSKDWPVLAGYMPVWSDALETYEKVARSFAVLNPIGAGAVIIYLQAAKKSRAVMGQAMLTSVKNQCYDLGIKVPADANIFDLLNLIDLTTAERAGEAIRQAQTLGTLALKSTPTNADIYVDGVATGLQTPETFKNLTAGSHEIAVSHYNSTTQLTDAYATTLVIVPGRKLEVTLHIAPGVNDDTNAPGDQTQGDVQQLPDFIKTTVTVDHMIDGDTFVTTAGEHVRILGMDAPETGQPIAEDSKTFMEEKLVDHKVNIKIQTQVPIDVYGRTLAIVTYRDENVAVSSIAAGLAKALIFDDARYDPTRYLAAQQTAQTRKVGIWSPNTPTITWRGT